MMINSMMMTISLTTIIMILSSITSKKINKDREKNSPFECGFDPFKSARLPFSSQFFLIAIVFLVFDVEIAILLPMPITISSSNTLTWMFTSLMFISILIIGLLHEWNQGSLDWMK
uniref:NADH-ubiquinone oxidoreductase chain 3 n=1 Tax=Nocticola sp. JW1 9/1 TaxID=2093475 RepID=A0A2P1H9H8_9NEOP|nr:NADH dehydrogenase subunit 3 [Nocticola sp. JW1 9/1]